MRGIAASGGLAAGPGYRTAVVTSRVRKFWLAIMIAALVAGAWSTAGAVATSNRQDGLDQLCLESEREQWFSNGWNCSRAGDNRERGELLRKVIAPSFGAAAVFLVAWRTRDRHRNKIVVDCQVGR